MDEYILCRSKWHLVCTSLMALHLICGQTNYNITVSQHLQPSLPIVCNTGGVAFNPSIHYDTNNISDQASKMDQVGTKHT